MFAKVLNHRGMTLIEVLVSAGLVAFIVGLSVTPIVQMKKLEKKAEFQSSIMTAHQVALQKARNGTYLKTQLGLIPPAGAVPPPGGFAETKAERCFGGRALATDGPCGIPDVIDSFTFTKQGMYAIRSRVTISVACQPAKCTQVTVKVDTAKTSGGAEFDWKGGGVLSASFKLPALSLGSRQEIDFSSCTAGKIITGIDYETLIATCSPIVGNVNCAAVPNAGPITTIGQSNVADPANCQTSTALSCPSGMAVFGIVNDQPECVNKIFCSDPLSTKCTPPVVACTPNLQPLPSTQCLGKAFTQIDANNCAGSVPIVSVGTNAAACVANSCTLSGPIRWPDPISGPCGVASAAGTASPGASALVTNENLGYYGTLTTTCVDNTPAPNTFNLASATNSCSPVLCTGIPSTLEWSNAGMKAGFAGNGLDPAGPWKCSGITKYSPSSTKGPGNLVTTDVDSNAWVSGTSATPAGTATITCKDPGPATAVRNGVLSVSSVSCAPQGYCIYDCIDNFTQGASGRLEIGETSTDTCKVAKAMLTKFSMGCNGFDGATCSLTNPNGPMSQAVCSGSNSGPKTCAAVPAATCSENVKNIGLEHNTGALPAGVTGDTAVRKDFAFTDDTCSKGLKNLIQDCTCSPTGDWNCLLRGNSPPDCSSVPGVKKWGGLTDGYQLQILNCFVAGTPVTMASGEKKNIEDVRLGEKLRTFDESTGLFTSSPVEEVLHHEEKDSVLYSFEFSNGNKVTSNDVHLFYSVSDRNYIPAKAIYERWQSGQNVNLLSDQNEIVSIADIRESHKVVKLYNLHVQSIYDHEKLKSRVGHNYFAGGVLVHNIKDVQGVCDALGLQGPDHCEDYSQSPTSTEGACCQAVGASVWITQTGQREVWCQGTCSQMEGYNACLSAPMNAKCGPANGDNPKTIPPVSLLCAIGGATQIFGTPPYSWTCGGINGGTSVNCATVPP